MYVVDSERILLTRGWAVGSVVFQLLFRCLHNDLKTKDNLLFPGMEFSQKVVCDFLSPVECVCNRNLCKCHPLGGSEIFFSPVNQSESRKNGDVCWFLEETIKFFSASHKASSKDPEVYVISIPRRAKNNSLLQYKIKEKNALGTIFDLKWDMWKQFLFT